MSNEYTEYTMQMQEVAKAACPRNVLLRQRLGHHLSDLGYGVGDGE